MDRRNALKTASAGFSTMLLAGAAKLPMPVQRQIRTVVGKGKILVGQTTYPVTKKFEAEVLSRHPDLAGSSYDRLTQMRDTIMRLSDLRNNYMVPKPVGVQMAPGGTVTVAERDRLDCITHVINVHHAVNFLQGRPISDFGFDGVDQVHGNAHHKPCGCIDTFVFDHHKRTEKDIVHHAHYPKHVCPEHANLA